MKDKKAMGRLIFEYHLRNRDFPEADLIREAFKLRNIEIDKKENEDDAK